MNKAEMNFFILLLESYASYKNQSATEILDIWKESGILQYIQDSYEMYHIESLENAFEDIDEKLQSLK
ncbi:MAG: DUF3791 domain-containing protein [Streptococcaceae bacterium]|jgi:hypothetical protein|nr:DUF3791 domain-containing protein [Streptococcaceae bacterium]